MTAVEILAASSGVLAGCLYFRDTLDPRRLLNLPVKVNCWFCCHDAKIPYNNQKAWTCPRKECSQFNGFEPDGGYSKEIKEQYIDPDENIGVRKIRYANSLHSSNINKNAANSENQNVLCRTCNLNQDLKIHQLKTFVPNNEADYDQEIEEFEAHLERTYRLCRYCEASLHQKLGEEDSWLRPKLLGWKLERNRQSPLSSAKNANFSRNKSLIHFDRIIDIMFRIFLTNAAILVSFLSTWELNYFHKFVNYSDEILSFAFGIDNIILPQKKITTDEEVLQYFRIDSKLLASKGLRQDVVISSVFILVLSGFWYFRDKLYRSTYHKLCLASWIFLVLQKILIEKQLLEVSQDILLIVAVASIVTSFIVSVVTINPKRNKRYNQFTNDNRKEHPNKVTSHLDLNEEPIQESLLDDTLTQDLVSTSTPVGSIVASNCLSVSHSSGQMPNIAPSRLNISNNSYGNSQTDSFMYDNESRKQEIISGKKCDISTLQIDTNKPTFAIPDSKNIETLSMLSGTFSLKRYDAINRSGIDFGDLSNNRAQHRGPLVKPSKFRSGSQNRFAKSSWVAGGYWLNNKYQQNKVNRNDGGKSYDLPETISNSSSQSSGFVSYSGQPFSMNNSLFNNSKFHQLRSDADINVFSKFTSDTNNQLPRKEQLNTFTTDLQKSFEHPKQNNSFSLNPINEQLAFFDTSSSSKYGNSRPNSPLSQYNELLQPNYSKISHNYTSLNYNEKERDNTSLNSSLNGLTQEAFLELRPKAESSPVANDKCTQNLKKKSWMEKKLTINISVYSIILFSSVAANIALIIYFLL